MKKVIVIGAGIGGLCTAIKLLSKGYDVTILEKEENVGGKVNIKIKNGARFDLTASVLMTPKTYTDIFSEVRKDYKDYFEMIKIDPIYNVFYQNKVIGVKTNNGNYKCDIVVCNADYPYAIRNLIKNKDYKKIEKQDYSCSVFMMYLGLSKKYENLQVHNFYIGKNFKNNVEDAFNGNLPKEPPLYLYYPSKIDKTISGKFNSILNVMVRVPNLKYKNIRWNKETIQKFRSKIIKELKNIDGLENIENEILYESYLTPIQLKYKFNSHNGTAFGLSHKLTQSAYFRPHIKDDNISGLYYIGSSTHPGNGVSVIINGSKILVDEICKE